MPPPCRERKRRVSIFAGKIGSWLGIFNQRSLYSPGSANELRPPPTNPYSSPRVRGYGLSHLDDAQAISRTVPLQGVYGQ